MRAISDGLIILVSFKGALKEPKAVCGDGGGKLNRSFSLISLNLEN